MSDFSTIGSVVLFQVLPSQGFARPLELKYRVHVHDVFCVWILLVSNLSARASSCHHQLDTLRREFVCEHFVGRT